MKDLELQGDLRDEYLANQEAEASTQEPELLDAEEIKEILRDIWEQDAARPVMDEEEEYTEVDAWRDFWYDREEAFN
tara:strand:- start:356 stop:586 length:231 start_codon:yes stop_codon:yes gene_type:complete